MLEDLKDAIIWFSDIDIGVSTLSEHAKKHIKTLLTLAEAAVESEGLPEKEIIHIEEAFPAFALLQAELAEAKREFNHLHECLNSLNASLDKQRLENMGAENARLAALEARVKGITEEDVLKLFCEHRKKCGFDAKTCTFIAASLLALVRGE